MNVVGSLFWEKKENEACDTVAPDVKGGSEHGLVYV